MNSGEKAAHTRVELVPIPTHLTGGGATTPGQYKTIRAQGEGRNRVAAKRLPISHLIATEELRNNESYIAKSEKKDPLTVL
tara:strand:+ start:134 stop:376 length:243 start_codon:yes stop_codon:yes gene_type:complete